MEEEEEKKKNHNRTESGGRRRTTTMMCASRTAIAAMIFPVTARSASSPSSQHCACKVDGYGEEIDWKEEGLSDGSVVETLRLLLMGGESLILV